MPCLTLLEILHTPLHTAEVEVQPYLWYVLLCKADVCVIVYLVFLWREGGGGGWSKCYNLQMVFCFFIQYCLVLSPLFGIRELDIFHVNCFVRANSSFPNDIPNPYLYGHYFGVQWLSSLVTPTQGVRLIELLIIDTET